MTRRSRDRLVMIEDVPPFAVVALMEHLRLISEKHGHYISSEATCTVQVELAGDEPMAFKRMFTELSERGILLEEVER